MKRSADKIIRKDLLIFLLFFEKLVNKYQKQKLSREVQQQKILLQHIVVYTHVVLLKRARMPEFTHSFMEE
jgi:hypothetical protein